MDALLLNMSLALLEGLALIISPCVLPILPIILTGALTGNKARPIGIIIGFILSFTVFVLFSRTLVQTIHINPEILHYLSYAMLLLFGSIMLSTTLTEKFGLLTQGLMPLGGSSGGNNSQSGFWSGILFGSLIGLIWTPCAGPILAAVLVQTILQQTNVNSALVILSFGIGAGIPMLLIAFLGRSIITQINFFRLRAELFGKLLGLMIILSVFYLLYQNNIVFTAAKLNTRGSATSLVNSLEHPYPAPAIAGIEAWINSPSLTLSKLKGKVVLVDFWTYSCINCIRTLPYLIDWYSKYHQQGLEIIGIHSPEFEFEKNLSNVKSAVKKFSIHYPVALDNEFTTWQHFQNRYWPAHFLINKEGLVVYQHFGEGEYDVTENNIRYLLGITTSEVVGSVDQAYSPTQTPETYLGYQRLENFASLEAIAKNNLQEYSYPRELAVNQWALKGKWVIHQDKIVADAAGASIKLHFRAGNIYVVMGPTLQPIPVRINVVSAGSVQINGHGGPKANLVVSRHQLYEVAELKQEGEGEVELTATQPGLELYTFTFGG